MWICKISLAVENVKKDYGSWKCKETKAMTSVLAKSVSMVIPTDYNTTSFISKAHLKFKQYLRIAQDLSNR